MGGMGRSFNGSYAEYALLPQSQVFAVSSSLPWGMLAAIPETFFTAWGSLFECLALKADESLLIRGGTCALGYAAISLAKALGCRVLATTHREKKLTLLKEAGADECILDDGPLSGRITVDKVLELIGPKTLPDSLRCVRHGGIVCNTGILGGVYYLDRFDPIKGIPNGVYLTSFFSNTPTQEVITKMFDFIEEHHIVPRVGKTYAFEQITQACMDMDSGAVDGKIVIVV
jgi:NADPH:quinone reductase-like Zn-dependent oxidoreductase